MSTVRENRPWLTILLQVCPPFSPEACCAALEAAGAGGQNLVALCHESERECALAAGRDLVRRGALHAFRCHSPQVGEHLLEEANRAAQQARTPYLLILSSSVVLAPDSLPPLLQRLDAEPDLAGVNPLFLYDQKAFSFSVESNPIVCDQPGQGACIAHMGCVADYFGQLQYLYEGLPLDHVLAGKRRRFQVGHAGALLLRREDFLTAGGFNAALDNLAHMDLCLKLAAPVPDKPLRAFSSEPSSRAVLSDDLDAWKTCGLWNSLLQRERLRDDLLRPDHADMARADGLEYICSRWLWGQAWPSAETTDEPAPDGEGGGLAVWLRWRHDPQPRTLLPLLHSMPPRQRALAVQLCRDLPSSLPSTLSWYIFAAEKLLACGKKDGLPLLAARAAEWLVHAEEFRIHDLQPGLKSLRDAGMYDMGLDNCPAAFDAWIELEERAELSERAEQERSKESRRAMENFDRLDMGGTWPCIAVVMPVYNPRPEHLRAALDSVLAQEYPHWQLCVADDASTVNEIPEILREYAAQEGRMRLALREQNGHISRASNTALELVDAPWTGFLDHDDLLPAHALREVAARVRQNPELVLIYSDEDKVDARGVRRTPIFKADFDPWLCAVWHFSVYATEKLRQVNGLRAGFEGSQDFDLSLRVAENLRPERVAHIPQILYHWRVHAQSASGSLGAKPYVLEATRRALDESACRRGLRATAAPTARNNFFVLHHEVDSLLRCSVVLLAADATPVPAPLWDDLLRLSRLVCLEVLCQPLNTAAADAFKRSPPQSCLNARLLPPPGRSEDGNWHAACNAAARAASGQVLLFLDARLFPLPGSQPEQLAVLALLENVGAVGGTLWLGNRLWHTGLMPDVTGLPFALHRGADKELLSSICWGQLLLTRRALAAPEQAMAVRRDVFLEHGGYDIAMGPWAGADLGLRLAAAGTHSLNCPWGQWHVPLQPGKALENVVSAEGVLERQRTTPQTRENFLARWGGIVRGSGLRNALLRAAPDQGWALMLKGNF
ncbi:glycosyltransferase [Desulfovibrio sp. 86]|uniref:Glycosyl transferase family 2 n=1 Tax=uncultured Desulfovibrio sp. TaxID=167968 RepID=A0A212KZH3_9BACT|nr:glycosyltransferase [Desulfovibrio sp. 86]SCM70646.1 Glycosyl transferase family 2 [uncultured Desulfovibrio sp.]VZH32410.1 Glycosyl transferase family 2 [Desulfovibrio sp. 86]